MLVFCLLPCINEHENVVGSDAEHNKCCQNVHLAKIWDAHNVVVEKE